MSADIKPGTTGLIDEAARRRFEAAWRAGRPEPIHACLPAEDHPAYLATLEELALIDMEFQAKTAPVRAEAYLSLFPVLNQPSIVRRLLKEEILGRRRRGDQAGLAEYQSRFPNLSISDVELDTTLRGEGDADPPPPLMPTLPGYEILGVLGRGGMGMVYRARQIRLRRVVAVKQILAGAGATAEDLARFRNEAEAVARLQHPNIVQVYEVGQADGRPFLALEFVEGGTLGAKLAAAPLPARQAAELAEVLARAVQTVHERGILHRDLKPGNILLTADGTPKITDFGLAKQLRDDPDRTAVQQNGVTQTGAVVGTPCYMSPEQAGGQTRLIGTATDVYSLGAILYEMLVGRPPFKAETVSETIFQVLHEEAVPPRRLQSKVPRDLETITLKCLQKEIGRRYAGAGALADDLRRFLDGHPIAARPVGRIERLWRWTRRQPAQAALAAALIVLAVGAVAGLFFWQHATYEREQQAAEFEHRQTQNALEFQLREKEVAQRQLANLRNAVDTNRQLARSELKQSRFDSGQKILREALKYLTEPGLEDLRGPVEKEYDQLGRLVDFYELSDKAERLAFLENDEVGLETGDAALERLGLYKNRLRWWEELPVADLKEDQITQLKKDAVHQLLVLGGVWAREAFTQPLGEKSKAACQKALNALEMVRAYHTAHKLPEPVAGRFLQLVCQFRLGRLVFPGTLKGAEPTTATDSYLVGMACYWIAINPKDQISQELGAGITLSGLDLGNFDQAAERLLRRAAADEPRHYWSQLWLGMALVRRDLHAAELAFTTCVALRPKYALSYALRSNILAQISNWTKDEREKKETLRRCLADMERAVQLEPDDWFVHVHRYYTFALLNRHDETVQAAGRWLELIPALDVPGSRRHQLPRPELVEAEARWAGHVDRHTNDAEVWSVLALTRLLLQSNEAAAAAAEKALGIALAPGHPRAAAIRDRALAVRGTAALRRKDLARATADLDEVQTRQPQQFLAALGRARIREEQSQWTAALSAYEVLAKSTAVEWQHLSALLGQARVLKALGRTEAARAVLERAKMLDAQAVGAQAAILFPPP